MIDILRVLFPALMVTGAAGSLITNIVSKGDWPVSLQWLGAVCYTQHCSLGIEAEYKRRET